MQIIKNKIVTFVIAIFLMLSMSASMVLTPTANAHTPTWTIPSFAYVTVAPTPVGVGQTVQVYTWVDTPLPSAAIPNDIRRHDYTLTITKPDGTTETKHWDVISDSTGIQFSTYTPEQIGNYTLNFSYSGQIYTWSGEYQNDTFTAATATTTLTVQQDPLPNPLSSYPLPTEYWTRPIEGQNTAWYAIASNWLNGPYIRTGASSTGGAGYGRFQPDGIAPNSAHIMWSKPIQYGGVVGGNDTAVSGETYYMGGSYNVRFTGAIVMQGTLFYQEPYGNGGNGGDYVAVDLQTGQEQWRINASATGTSLVPSFGYLYSFETGNQHGVLPDGLLIASTSVANQGTVWRGYDPRTGVLTTMNVTNVPSGTTAAGPSGEYLQYILTNLGTTTNPKYYLMQWNSSNVFGTNSGNGVGNWYSGMANASLPTAYDWNITIPSLSTTGWSIYRDIIFNNILLLTQGSFGTGPRTTGQGANVTAISLKPGNIGQVLWTKYYAPAPNNVTRVIVAMDSRAGTFVTQDKETMTLTGFSLTDGSQLWSTPNKAAVWDTMRDDTLAAYGNLYCAGFDGILYCYSMQNGALLWTYGNGGAGNSTYAGLETAYGHYPIFVDVIANGKVFLGTTEHSPNSPWYKDSEYRCIDAYTGKEISTIMGWGTGMYVGQYDMVADGLFVYLNCYDMQIYTAGKGPSATTVEAPMTTTTIGSSVVIRGSVTDISAGTEQNVIAKRFPSGVPAVSDASQAQWMEYVYMQKPRPTNTVGVPVILSVVDANGNYREIGNTTSNDGFFTFNWKPDITGQYTVYASFAGSESYWPSNAITSFVVDSPQPTASPQAEQILPPTEMYITAAAAATIIVVAIVGALILVSLKKRP